MILKKYVNDLNSLLNIKSLIIEMDIHLCHFCSRQSIGIQFQVILEMSFRQYKQIVHLLLGPNILEQ